MEYNHGVLPENITVSLIRIYTPKLYKEEGF